MPYPPFYFMTLHRLLACTPQSAEFGPEPDELLVRDSAVSKRSRCDLVDSGSDCRGGLSDPVMLSSLLAKVAVCKMHIEAYDASPDWHTLEGRPSWATDTCEDKGDTTRPASQHYTV